MQLSWIFLSFLLITAGAAQQAGNGNTASTGPSMRGKAAPAQSREADHPSSVRDDEFSDVAPVITHHQMTVGGKSLRYTATTGCLPIRPENSGIEAELFFTAYTLDGDEQRRRPLTFVFNGGPGTATAWLHMGAVGPRKIRLEHEGAVPAPPYETIENPDTLLDRTDLVFIDAPGTGFSRVKPDAFKKYYNMSGDLEAFGRFIHLYLTRYQRWHSPIFLFGESYGTTRAAGLVNYLSGDAIPVNGIAMLSTALDFQALEPGPLNDLPYELIVPSYTVLAAYHKKLRPDLAADLDATLKEVEQWASTEYAHALAMGTALPADQRQKVIAQLAAYTGLKPELVDENDLRISAETFRHKLLQDQGLTIGRVDGRFTAPPQQSTSGLFDPAMALLFPAYAAVMNDYAETELGYKPDLAYKIWAFDDVYRKWEWPNAMQGYPQTLSALQSAMGKDKHLKVVVMQGIYDLATPYYATAYTFNHLRLPPQYLKNITFARFKGGHMAYDDAEGLKEMKRVLDRFYQNALNTK